MIRSSRISPRYTLAVAAGLALAACGSAPDDGLDPAATYTSFGHAFEPAAALPVQAVLAEPESYAGDAVMIEGLATDCADASCWLRMTSGDTTEVRIPSPDFAVPDTIAGRRLVIHGLLTADTTDAETGANSTTDQSAAGTHHPLPTTYYIHPTGLMVEKVR